MGIGKVLSVIPEIAGKCRIWSNGKVVRSCLEAGEDFTKVARENGGKLTIEQINNTYRRILPKGSNIQAVSDHQQVGTFLRNMKFDEDTVAFLSNGTQALVIKNFKGETLFFVPIEKFAGDKAVNIATHEFEHVLNGETTIGAKINKMLMKVLGQKRAEKLALKDSEAVNMKFMTLQQDLVGRKLRITDPLDGTIPQNADTKGLLDYLGVSSKGRLDVQLRKSVRKVLDPEAERKNVKYLKVMRAALSDEARAYRAGGQTAKEYLGLKEGSTMSEMTSQLYDETVGVIEKEIKAQRKKGLKRALGMKVRNYEGPGKRFKITGVNVKRVAPSELPEDLIAALTKGEAKTVKLDEIV